MMNDGALDGVAISPLRDGRIAARICGCDLLPLYFPLDTVVVDPAEEAWDGCMALAQLAAGQAVVGRYGRENGVVTLHAIGAGHPNYRADRDDFKIVGPVVEHLYRPRERLALVEAAQAAMDAIQEEFSELAS